MSNGNERCRSLTSSIRRKLSLRKKKSSSASVNSESSYESVPSPSETSFSGLDIKDEATYCSLLRTLVAPLGIPSCARSGHSLNSLTDRLKMIYEIDPSAHERCIKEIKEEEIVRKMNDSTALLYVHVMEAIGVHSSEEHSRVAPYCLLTVVRPHGSRKGTPTNSPRLGLKHKKASFELADVKQTKSATNIAKLNWNEEFMIDVQDIATDVLEVYISNSELYQNKSDLDELQLRNVFKQVKHSFEHGKSHDGGEVMGIVKVPLKEVLATGTTSWYDLTTKSKWKRGGKIHLQLQLQYKACTHKEDAESEQDCQHVALDQYYCAMKRFHQKAAKKAEGNVINYNGKLTPEDDLILDYFSVPHGISDVSKLLLKLVCLLETAAENVNIKIKKEVIREAISNFESKWCSLQMDMAAGGNKTVSPYELQLLKQATDNYIRHIAHGVEDVPHLFPTHQNYLDQFYSKFEAVSRLLNLYIGKDWTPAAKKDLIAIITDRIQSDAKQWLDAQLETVNCGTSMRDSVIPEIRQFDNVINDAIETCTPKYGYTQIFAKFDIDFYKMVSIALDRKLSAKIQEIMISMDKYQLRYHKCHVNIQQSCTLSLKLYLSLRKLYLQMKENVSERQIFKLTLSKFYLWFSDALIFWLQMFRKESISRMEKALEIDKDVVQVTELVKFSNSSVDVLHCFSQIISEWEQIDYVSPDTKLMGVTKLTDTICDGTRIYTHRIRTILEKNGYYDQKDEQFDITTRLCITLNNIEHVRRFLDDLPGLLHWKDVVEEISLAHEEEEIGERAMITLSELVKDAICDVKMQSTLLLKEITSRMKLDISKYTELYTQTEPGKMSSIDPLLEYFENNLGTVNRKLFDAVMVPMFEELWNTTLQCLEENILKGCQPKYYMSMQSRLASLKLYFINGGVCDEAMKTPRYREIISMLQVNSMETEELVLDYYENLSSVENMLTPLDYYGHICIKLAYVEEMRGNVTLFIKVISASDLPGLDRTGLSDPYVKLRLNPSFLFPTKGEQRTKIVDQTLNPEFHQTFEISEVPKDYLERKGSAIQFVVMDHDTLTKDDFAGECFVELSTIKSMKGFQTVESMGAIIVPLKRPNAMSQPRSFWIADERSGWDKHAKEFVTNRREIIEHQPTRTDNCKQQTRFAFFTKLVEKIKSVGRSLDVCCEDTTSDAAKNGSSEASGASNNNSPKVIPPLGNLRSVSDVTQNASDFMEFPDEEREEADRKGRSQSFDTCLQDGPRRRNPFLFPPQSSALIQRRRARSETVNVFFADYMSSRRGGKGKKQVNEWNHEDAGAWDGYIGEMIPEASGT